MAASGFTPISLYNTTTASAVPAAGNLVAGELAINITDGKLYFKNTGGTVTLLSSILTAVANGGTGVTSSTGSGSNVLNTSPTLVTPALGTPASGVATNITGLPLASGVTGNLPIANGGTGSTSSTGSGSNVLNTSPTLVTPALGTPTSGVATNITGLPLASGVTGNLPVANGGTGVTSSTGTGSVVLNTSPSLTTPIVDSLNGGQLSGFRNKIINGSLLINQRAVSGTVSLSAGVYGHDRFKAGSGGCTYTFNTVGTTTTITISAGSLVQVIEGFNIDQASYIFGWTGTAQARILGGTYGNAPVTLSATAGSNLSVEFGIGTVSKVQVETGTIATPFEQRLVGVELLLCQRYCQPVSTGISAVATSTTQAIFGFPFLVSMRASPSFNAVSGQTVISNGTAFASTSAGVLVSSSTSGASFTIAGFTGLITGSPYLLTGTASSPNILSAEL